MPNNKLRQLIERYPNFFQVSPPEPTPFAERGGFECGEGWYGPLLNLGYHAEQVLAKYPNSGVYTSQVKEKFGTLRVYLDGHSDHPAYVAIQALIEEAEVATSALCEVCGAPGEMVKAGWRWVACPTHLQERQARRQTSIKPHTWGTQTIDGGYAGGGSFFECSVCNASGGCALPGVDEPTRQPFLSGLGSTVSISLDCREAKRQIDEIIASKSWQKRRLEEAQHSGRALIEEVRKCYGVEMKMGRRGILYGGWPDKGGRAFKMTPKDFRSSLGWELKLHDGTTQDLTYYNPACNWLHEFYSPLVFSEVASALQAALDPKGFTVTLGYGRVSGAVLSKDEKGRDRADKGFSVTKPSQYAIQIYRRYPLKDEHFRAASVRDVVNILLRQLEVW